MIEEKCLQCSYRKALKREVLSCDNLIMDVKGNTVARDGKEIKLSKTEFDLLKLFLLRKNTVVLTEEIKASTDSFKNETNLLNVYVCYLRRKVDGKFKNKLIHTIRDVGYKMQNKEGETYKNLLEKSAK